MSGNADSVMATSPPTVMTGTFYQERGTTHHCCANHQCAHLSCEFTLTERRTVLARTAADLAATAGRPATAAEMVSAYNARAKSGH